MKALSATNTHTGASTLEILLAFAILTLALSAAAMVIYGNQYAAVMSRLNLEAVRIAEAQLEEARATSRLDAFLLVATTSTQLRGGVLYTQSLSFSPLKPFVMQATSTVSWTQGGSTRSVVLSTFLGDVGSVQGGSTCSATLGSKKAFSISAPFAVGSNVDGNPITGVVAHSKKLYVTSSDTHGHNVDITIFDISGDPKNPMLLSSLDANTTTPGLNAIAIDETPVGTYAFVANAHPANWSTCTTGPSCAQVLVIDVTHPANPGVVRVIRIPSGATPLVLGSGGQAVGNAVTYRNGYLYIGLTKTSSGPEFIVYDVGAQSGSPLNPVYAGSFAVGRGISSIAVVGSYAYLATSDVNRELLMLDIHTPATPVQVGLFNAPGSSGFGAGYSLASLGQEIFLGRNYVGNAPELYGLDASMPQTTLPVVTSLDIGTSINPESVNGLVAVGNKLFVVATNSVRVYDMSPPSNLTQNFLFDVSRDTNVATAVSCEGEYVYIGGYQKPNDKGVLYVMSSQ